jgi:cytochrome o ubiquinol oxidase operon protein cyoD
VTAFVILAFAAVQIVVHMIYFLHMNTRSEGGWSMLALIFTVVLVFIVLTGSIWVMYHLDHNMMPGMAPAPAGTTVQQMHDMP